MIKIKKGLGRGLSSLIGENKVETSNSKLSLSEIIPNRYQPRKNFDEGSLEELSNSIKEDKPLPNPFFILFITLHSQFYFPD